MALRKSRAGDVPRITPAKAKRMIAVAKVVGPALVPVVLPYLTRTAGTVRDGWDRLRARRLGVGIDDLARYTGRGATLHARIVGAADSLAALRERDEDTAFVETGAARLRQLTAAVRAAERMPAARRRSAHRAVSAELDRIEGDILNRLGV
jgi:hypothetical protein